MICGSAMEDGRFVGEEGVVPCQRHHLFRERERERARERARESERERERASERECERECAHAQHVAYAELADLLT